jgi:hypothetical protein
MQVSLSAAKLPTGRFYRISRFKNGNAGAIFQILLGQSQRFRTTAMTKGIGRNT